MKKFEGMLFCTDLDGTLLSSDKTISGKNSEAIEYFKSEGGLFTFITGRVPKTSNKIYEMVNPNAPYGCVNGGGIYDPVQNKYLWKRILPREGLLLVRAVDENLPEIGIQLNTEKEIYTNKDNDALVRFRKVTGIEKIARHYDDVEEDILKVVLAHKNVEMIEALARFLNSHPKASDFDFIRSEKSLYEILPKGVSKGALILKMAELLGISPDKTIAIGDYNNDVSMIKSAKLGVAVSNAVEEAKAVADYVTVSNEEDAIWHIVDLLDRGELTL